MSESRLFIKIKKSGSWSSSVDFFLIFHPNLDLKHSMDAELSLEEDRIKMFKRFGVLTDQFALKCFTNRKNSSFYRDFGRNRAIELINDFDETVHHEPLRLSPVCWIANRCVTWSHVDMRFKVLWNDRHWIAIWRVRCVFFAI